jgi:hypothetical protein
MKVRKYIRIALSSDDEDAFDKAKSKAEAASGVTLSDSAFSLGVIRKAIHKAALD